MHVAISSQCTMMPVNKTNEGAECRAFQKKWTNDYFYVEVKVKCAQVILWVCAYSDDKGQSQRQM